MSAQRKVKEQSPSRSRRRPHVDMWENLDHKQIEKIKEHIQNELEGNEELQKKAALILEDWLKNNT